MGNGNVPFSGVTSATLVACCFSRETAVVNTEEGEDDVKSAWSSDALGDTRATMAGTAGSQAVTRSESPKNPVSVGIVGCNSPA